MSELWKGSYDSFAFVPYGNWVALYANTPDWPWPYTGTDFQTGIFLIDAATFEADPGEFPRYLGLLHSARVVRPLVTSRSTCSSSRIIPARISSIYPRTGNSPRPACRQTEFPCPLTVSIGSPSPTTIQIFSDDGSLIRTVDLPAGLDPKNIGVDHLAARIPPACSSPTRMPRIRIPPGSYTP